MQKYDQSGSTSVVLCVLFGILFVAAAGFGGWAFMGRQDYKNNTQAKVNVAVDAAKKVQADQLQKQFNEESKNPNKAYQANPTYGGVTFDYPKTWSAYVDETSPSEPINGYFYPDKVPGIQSGTAYALRVELISITYPQAISQYNSFVKAGKLKATAYVPPKMAGKPNLQPGTKFDGAIGNSSSGAAQQGSIVIIQVRDKTLKISTQSPNFLNDFNNSVLANLTFIP
jgi:hypothetical protein